MLRCNILPPFQNHGRQFWASPQSQWRQVHLANPSKNLYSPTSLSSQWYRILENIVVIFKIIPKPGEVILFLKSKRKISYSIGNKKFFFQKNVKFLQKFSTFPTLTWMAHDGKIHLWRPQMPKKIFQKIIYTRKKKSPQTPKTFLFRNRITRKMMDSKRRRKKKFAEGSKIFFPLTSELKVTTLAFSSQKWAKFEKSEKFSKKQY